MKAVLEILTGLSIDPGSGNFSITVMNSPWVALHIEAIGEGPNNLPAISVAHYGLMNGDLMRDPDVCFELRDGAMVPFSFRNDYAGVDIKVPAGAHPEHPMILSIADFARMWSTNLYEQGFVQAALTQPQPEQKAVP